MGSHSSQIKTEKGMYQKEDQFDINHVPEREERTYNLEPRHNLLPTHNGGPFSKCIAHLK